ncbi:MAG: hypothetical protein ACE15F_14765 [bacterium]
MNHLLFHPLRDGICQGMICRGYGIFLNPLREREGISVRIRMVKINEMIKIDGFPAARQHLFFGFFSE